MERRFQLGSVYPLKGAEGTKEADDGSFVGCGPGGWAVSTFQERANGSWSTRAELGGIVVEDVKGELNSRTFGVRMWLLGPLGPMPTVVGFLIEMAIIPFVVWAMPKVGCGERCVWNRGGGRGG